MKNVLLENVDFCSVKNIILEAISRFNEKDKNLLNLPYANDGVDPKLHEVCISHKLANHLESILKENFLIKEDIVVDIEYNRHIGNVKTNNSGEGIRPDIIVHQRGTDENNFLIIELKKSSNLGRDNQNLNEDIKRINEMCDISGNYKYKFGFVLIANEDTIKIHHPEQ